MLKKAEELVFSYAKVVYSENELESMRMELLKSNGMMNMGDNGGS